MTSLQLIAAFASAARHASFAGAARELGLSPSAVAKSIARLEVELGVRLFHRTTRRVSLSPDGQDLYARCRRILEEVESLEADARGAGTEVRGTLRIDLPVTYGRQVVLPVITSLMAHHPALLVDARFSDRFTDIVQEGLDAAVRIGPPADSRLVARRFDRQRLGTFASPRYLAGRRRPGAPADLAKHTCLLFRMPTSGRDRPWAFRVDGRDVSFVPESGVRLGDGEALVRAAADGAGIIQVPGYMAQDAVREGGLVEVLQRHRPAPLPISLVYPSRRHVPPRVRALGDALAEAVKRGER